MLIKLRPAIRTAPGPSIVQRRGFFVSVYEVNLKNRIRNLEEHCRKLESERDQHIKATNDFKDQSDLRIREVKSLCSLRIHEIKELSLKTEVVKDQRIKELEEENRMMEEKKDQFHQMIAQRVREVDGLIKQILTSYGIDQIYHGSNSSMKKQVD